MIGALGLAGAGVVAGKVLGSRSALHGAVATGSSAGPSVRSGGGSSPSASIPRTPTPTPKRGVLLIHGAGDTSLDANYIPNFRVHGFEYAWEGLNGLFVRDDLAVVNCECPVSNLAGVAVPKQAGAQAFHFKGDPAGLPAMRRAGIEAVNLGNNHAYDYGPAVLVDSIANIKANDITPVGAGAGPNEALAAAFFDRNGWRIAVVGFDKTVDPYPQAVAAPGHPGTAAGHDLDLMVSATKAAKEQADLVIANIHWGVELDTAPRPDDVALAHRLTGAGADIIFGGHSHRLQPMEMVNDRPVFYSLGSFIWPQLSSANATTAVAEVQVSATGRFTGKLLPAYIAANGHPVLR